VKYLYVDSSIIVSLMFSEKGGGSFKKQIAEAENAFSSSLLEAEVFAAARREGLSLSIAEEFIETVSLVFPDRSLKDELMQILSGNYCRGADACHLATALYLDPEMKNLVFLSADQAQSNIAKKMGFAIWGS
jgi:predicted nucleic acid-binding protein